MNLQQALNDFKSIDFKSLDPNNPGNWPLPVRVLALVMLFIATLVGGYFLDWSGQMETLDAAKAEEERLRKTFLEKKQQAINLPIYKQQLQDIERSFGTLLRQLPNKSEMDALITDINQAGLGRGLEFELFKPAAHETVSEFYAELPIVVKVTGNYHDFGAFASDVSQLPRIVTLNNIAITPEKGGSLGMSVVAKTYRYLSSEEIAARRKAAEKNKPKPKPAEQPEKGGKH